MPAFVSRCHAIATSLCLTAFLLLPSGCSRDSNSSADATQSVLRIAVIPKGTSHEFWKSVHFGAQKAAKELGNVEVIWRGPVVESDTGSQIEVVKDMITIGVDGIVLAPNQKGGLVDPVQEAIGEGIPVVIFDSGLDDGPEIVSYVATDNYIGGQMAAEAMAKAIDEKGNVILLRYIAGSESTEQRENGFLDRIADYPDITVVSSDQYAGDNATSAKEKADQLLQLHGDSLAGIFAVCEPNANGTLEAIKNAGLAGKVKFIGFDPSDALIGALGNGHCHGIVLQDPVQMGYQSVMTIVDYINGESAEEFQSTGEYLATPENMDEELYQRLLHPPTIE
ncbi:ABC transporter substrate-binding protein [Roseiconus nitratireducens]|uniref:ABC transporter substrate-binding protein n=1 Tax=Roseiconus nitratireducens TaxID=2605748 RepID=A0A5M6DE59_9BACT|nr:substrate-binding domain-containing protein [Roseiconus nitratireducens]KAA5544439.1 ABC transporter substrate-binding protein [Roseiconus nitratireducens]